MDIKIILDDRKDGSLVSLVAGKVEELSYSNVNLGTFEQFLIKTFNNALDIESIELVKSFFDKLHSKIGVVPELDGVVKHLILSDLAVNMPEYFNTSVIIFDNTNPVADFRDFLPAGVINIRPIPFVDYEGTTVEKLIDKHNDLVVVSQADQKDYTKYINTYVDTFALRLKVAQEDIEQFNTLCEMNDRLKPRFSEGVVIGGKENLGAVVGAIFDGGPHFMEGISSFELPDYNLEGAPWEKEFKDFIREMLKNQDKNTFH